MLKVFVVRDRKAKTFWAPVYDRDSVHAIRSFESTCRDPQSQFAKWPSDFELLYLGMFNQETGKFNLLEYPEVLAEPNQFLSQPLKVAQ